MAPLRKTASTRRSRHSESLIHFTRIKPDDHLQEYVCAANERDVARFAAGQRQAAPAAAPQPGPH